MYNDNNYEFDNKKGKSSLELPLPGLELVLPIEAYRKIMAYAEAAGHQEITGFADVEYLPEKGMLLAGEVYLMEQNAGGADVHIEEEDMAKFNLEMAKAGKTQLPQIWWHSHVDMQAFFSSTDEGTSEQLQNETFNISLVVNKKHDMRAKMYIAVKGEVEAMGEKMEIKEWMCIDPLPVRVMMEWARIPKEINDEVKLKLKENFGWAGLFRGKKDKDEEKEEKKSSNRRDNQAGGTDAEYKKFHDKYTDDKRIQVFRLPKNEKEAKRKIIELGLKESFNTKSGGWVWENEVGNIFYVDVWEVLPANFNPNPII